MKSSRLVATGPGCQSVCQVYVQLGQKGLKKTLLRGPVPQGDRGWGKWFCFVATGRGCQCVKCVYNWNRRDVRVRALGTVLWGGGVVLSRSNKTCPSASAYLPSDHSEAPTDHSAPYQSRQCGSQEIKAISQCSVKPSVLRVHRKLVSQCFRPRQPQRIIYYIRSEKDFHVYI